MWATLTALPSKFRDSSSYTVHVSQVGGIAAPAAGKFTYSISSSMPSALRLLPLAFPGQLSASAGQTLGSTSALDMKPGKQRVSEVTLMHTEAPLARLQLHPLHPGLCSLCTSRNTHRPGHRLLISHWLLSSCSFPALFLLTLRQ